MEYKIHGTPVNVDGECGMYIPILKGMSMEYASMDSALIVSTINGMPRDYAIEAVTILRDQAAEQAKRTFTPQNVGFPILIQTPGPTPINEVRGNIINTERFCNDVLNALQGK